MAPVIRYVVFEASLLLRLTARAGSLDLYVEFALDPGHPEWRKPPADQAFDYRTGVIRFTGVSRLIWGEQPTEPGVDSSGEPDWGEIHEFSWIGTSFEVRGDFGMITIEARRVSAELDARPNVAGGR